MKGYCSNSPRRCPNAYDLTPVEGSHIFDEVCPECHYSLVVTVDELGDYRIGKHRRLLTYLLIVIAVLTLLCVYLKFKYTV